MTQHKYDNYFPYINDFISFRLTEESVQFRNLKKRVDTIIDLNGSAYPFVRELTGLSSVSEIFSKLNVLFENIGLDVIQQDYTEVLELLLKEQIITLAEQPINKSKEGLKIIAPDIRSSIHFDITHKCNELCIHCLVDKDNAEAETKDILDILRQSANLGFTSYSISGGEPSIHPDFYKILTAARDLGFYFTLFSNVINMTEDDVAKIAGLFPDKIRISLYSMLSETHDQITQISGSHKKTMLGIMLFKNASVPLYINIPVTNKNFDGYQNVADFCDKNGFERSIDPVVQPTRDLRDKNMNLQLTYLQAKEATAFQQTADVLVANVKDGNIVCNAGADPSIDANLNVYPCPGIRVPLGNLNKSTLAELIYEHPLIEELQNLNLEKLKVCQACEYLSGCYRCHGHSQQDEGSLYGCSWYDKRQAKIRQEIITERGCVNE